MSNKNCPFGKCKKCLWWREWRFTNEKTGENKLEMKCSIEVLLNYIPQIAGSIDGLQGGVNEARNRMVETKNIIINYAEASMKTLEGVGQKLLGRGKT